MKPKPPTKEQQAEICRLYTSGLLLNQVAKQTGFCTTTIKKFMLLNGCESRGRGTRLGTGRVRAFDDSVLVSFKQRWDRLDSTVKGTIAETHAATRLSELGFDVWEPFCQNHKTDFLIATASKFLKVQVKSATYDLKTKSFRANVTRRRRNGNVSGYALEDVDFFIIYCGGFDSPTFYVIPSSQVFGGRSDAKLYPHRDKSASPMRTIDWEPFKNAFSLIV